MRSNWKAINRVTPTSKSSYVTACGVITFVVKNDDILILILKNSDTYRWDFPKGLLDFDDSGFNSYWRCAKRELAEETGIDVSIFEYDVGAPYSYFYSISPTKKKKVALFPLQLYQVPNVILSGEHIDSRWVSVNDIEKLDLYTEQLTTIRTFLADFNLKTKSVSKNREMYETIRCALPDIIERLTSSQESNWFWYGSWVTNEQRTKPNLLSDIDLVCFGSNILTPEVVRDNQRYLSDELSATVGEKLSCGIHYFPASSTVFERAPQWTYFNATKIEVFHGTMSSGLNFEDMTFSTSKDISNEYARLIWHRLSVLETENSDHAAYGLTKGVIFLAMLCDENSNCNPFIGYLDLFQQLLSKTKYAGPQDFLSLEILCKAIDEKLGHRNLSSVEYWLEVFCEAVESALKCNRGSIDDISFCFCQACISILRNEVSVATAHCKVIANTTGMINSEFVAQAAKIKNQVELRLIVVCLLAAFRVVLWPQHMQFAAHKQLQHLEQWRRALIKLESKLGVTIANVCIEATSVNTS